MALAVYALSDDQPDDPVRALVERWRANAAVLRRHDSATGNTGADTQEFCANELDAALRAREAGPEREPNRCLVCRYDYPIGGQHAGQPWGLVGSAGFKICKYCVQAGRDNRRQREQAYLHEPNPSPEDR